MKENIQQEAKEMWETIWFLGSNHAQSNSWVTRELSPSPPRQLNVLKTLMREWAKNSHLSVMCCLQVHASDLLYHILCSLLHQHIQTSGPGSTPLSRAPKVLLLWRTFPLWRFICLLGYLKGCTIVEEDTERAKEEKKRLLPSIDLLHNWAQYLRVDRTKSLELHLWYGWKGL